MKSMLHEASTVTKAIEKAWIDSGKPLEFTVKVLEMGEKGFLGFTKRPAIVSIAYDPKKQTLKNPERREVASLSSKGQPRQPQRIGQQAARQEQRSDDKKRAEPQHRQRPARDVQPQHVRVQPQQDEQWTPEMIEDIKHWLNEMLVFLNIDAGYTARADKRMLALVFDKQLLSTPEEERQLFVGLSYLVIQFLKKKHKKKFRGYHLVISTKEHAASNKAE